MTPRPISIRDEAWLREHCRPDGSLMMRTIVKVIELMDWRVAEEREKVKAIYRKCHSGECRMFSEGHACKCFLCEVDDLSEMEAGK